MSGPLLLLLLVGVATADYCVYDTGLIDEYLADVENLYCFDGGELEIESYSKLCSAEDAFVTPRADDLSVRCPADEYTLVGYNNYFCDEETSELAAVIINDAVLTPFSYCNNDTAAICLGVNAANAAKLLVSGPVENIDLQGADDESIVYYGVVCDDGYDFVADVEGIVYAYCSSNLDGANVLSFHADVAADGCYETCPANPVNGDESNFSDVIPNFSEAVVEEAQKSGAVVSIAVVCDEGYEIASDAAEEYSFSCDGLLEGVAASGLYSCGDACPVCLATCPANPGLDNLAEVYDNLASLVIAGESASGLTVAVEVVCEEGYGLANDAPVSYDFICSSDNETAASSGSYSLVGEAPACLPGCAEDTAEAIEFATFIKIESGFLGQVKEAFVVCDSTYSLPLGHDGAWEFVCEAGDDGPLSGIYACADGCPVCEEFCVMPEDDDEFHFALADQSYDIADFPDGIPPGIDIIEASCKNESLNLVGHRFYSCLSGGEFNNTAEEVPYCADTPICEAPVLVNADVNTNHNLEVGGVYTVTCQSSYWFDVTTAQEYGDLSDDTSYYTATVECNGEELPAFTCYFGCLPPDFAGGVTSPDIATDGQAPFAMGAAVTFSCLDGNSLAPAEAEATCEPGGIPSPVCSACSMSIAFSLVLSFLVLLA